MRTRSYRATALSVLACFSLVATACGDDDDDDAGGAATTAEGTEGTDGTTATTTAGTEPTDGAATETTTAGTESEGTSAPTAPPRGDADLVVWTDDTRQDVVQGIADVFAEENGITVEVQQLDFGQIREQFSLAAPAGDGPDIVIGAHDWIGEFVANGVVEPIDLSGVADQFDPVAVDAVTFDGQTYALPYSVENIALLRNTDLVPTVPATFEELIQAATDFKAQYANDPSYQGLALQAGPEGDTYHFHPILTAFGGYVFAQNEDGTFNPDDLGIDSPGGIAAAQFLSEQASAGLLSADVTYDVMIESFGEGRAAFAITGPWAIGEADRGFAATGVPYEVTAIPPRADGTVPQPFVGVQGFMISSFSEQKDLATSFVLDFMSQESSQLALFETGGRPPALTSAKEAVSDDPDIQGFAASGSAGIPLPAIPEMSTVFQEVNLAELNVLQGADPTTEFTNAAEAIRASIGG